jgi:hypothetical protein
MKMPETKVSFFPLKGGLDLVTPHIEISNGKLYDSKNYEPQISGGYRRIDGYERYDGRAATPTAAKYWTLPYTKTATPSVGATVTGGSSGATGVVLAVNGTTLILGVVVGSFTQGETLTSGGSIGLTTATATASGATSASDDADYMLLAANYARTSIQPIAGNGSIRGVWIYKDVTYAFRDNGAFSNMYKATSSGWVQINLGTEIQYTSATGGTTPIAVGQTIGNAASSPTKTAIVTAVLLRTGTWGTNAVGTLVITPVTGTFSNADPIYVGATQKAVASTAATAITRAAGGTLEFVNANFTGSTSTLKMYGVDGVNLAFEFDGTTYVPIRTGMATDTPEHVAFNKNYLWLSFYGSLQFSALGSPYSWTAILGAGEIATGDQITGMTIQTGTQNGSSMAVFTKGKTYILYGSSAANWQLTVSVYELGTSARTAQPVGNNTFGLTARGVYSLITTLNYGDFEFASVTHLIQPYLVTKRGLEQCSSSSREKGQYRLYFSDNTALVIGFTGDEVNGMTSLDYGRPVRCVVTQTLSSGREVTFFGSDDGYVYQDNTGTSFDGQPIEAFIRTTFNHLKSPRVRKKFRRAIFEALSNGYANVKVSYELGYGSLGVASSDISDYQMMGQGGYWDQFTYESFTWDQPFINEQSISLDGTEKNISFLFYSNRAQDVSHTFQGVSVHYTPQLLQRV